MHLGCEPGSQRAEPRRAAVRSGLRAWRLVFKTSRGVPPGCPLSPRLGALFLEKLDGRLEATGLFFVRFMADVLAPPGWKLWHVMLDVWMLFLVGQPWYQSTQVAAIPYNRVLAYQAGGV